MIFVWFLATIIKLALFIAFTISLTLVLGGSIMLGVAIGTGLSFLQTVASTANNGENLDDTDPEVEVLRAKVPRNYG